MSRSTSSTPTNRFSGRGRVSEWTGALQTLDFAELVESLGHVFAFRLFVLPSFLQGVHRSMEGSVRNQPRSDTAFEIVVSPSCLAVTVWPGPALMGSLAAVWDG